MQNFILDKQSIQPALDKFIDFAQTLEAEDQLAKAIQAYDTILLICSEPPICARANFHLSKIYHEWGESFASHRLLLIAQELDPTSPEISNRVTEANQYMDQNREQISDEWSRKNSDQIVSLFRIATGLKLLQMDKPVPAYPLMRSRTKIYPNAAIAKHLLTDVIITADEKNSAIEFLEEREGLVNTRSDFYSITESGLYQFYTELAQLHVANEVYDEAARCYEQAYWLDDSEPTVLYHAVICNAKSEAWEDGLGTLEQLSNGIPEGVEPADYHTAVAQLYSLAYQSTSENSMRLRAVEACEASLGINRKNRQISKLLRALRQSDSETAHEPKQKRWWRR
jgi:tetratricopeptide (TPR) repeat protein